MIQNSEDRLGQEVEISAPGPCDGTHVLYFRPPIPYPHVCWATPSLDWAAAWVLGACPRLMAGLCVLAVGLQVGDPGLRSPTVMRGSWCSILWPRIDVSTSMQSRKCGLCSVHLQQAVRERPRLAICLRCSTVLWALWLGAIFQRTCEGRAFLHKDTV
jgi:hypothetical protein